MGTAKGRSGNEPQVVFTPLSFVAGCFSGAVGTTIGYPLDVIKVHAQAKKPLTLHWRTLMRGAGVPIATAGAVQSINLGMYENIRRWTTPQTSLCCTPLTHIGFAASLAGLCIAPITCPIQRVKIMQQLNGTSLLATVRVLTKERSLYRGFPASALFEATRCLYMISYEIFKRTLRGRAISPEAPHGGGEERPLSLGRRVLAGSAANVVTWSVIYPIDVVKTVQQAQAGTCRASNASLQNCVRRLFAEGGYSRFYRGFVYTLIRAGPVAGVLLPLFDISLATLQKM